MGTQHLRHHGGQLRKHTDNEDYLLRPASGGLPQRRTGPGWTRTTPPKTCNATKGSQLGGRHRRAVRPKCPVTYSAMFLATSGLHQLLLLLLTVGVFLLEVVPLELQRRIVNDLVKHRDFWLVIVLCACPAELIEHDAKQECPEEPAAKADAGIRPHGCSSVPRSGNGEDTRSEIREVALYDEASDH